MKKMYPLLVLIIMSNVAMAQLPVAYYDFETTANRNTFENAVQLSVNSGAATFTKSNGTLSNAAGAGTANGGAQDGRAITISRGATSSSTDPMAAATAYLQFKVSTSGFTGIGLSHNVLVSNIHSPFYGISISTNGSTWTWIGSVNTPGTGFFPWPYDAVTPYWVAGACSFPAMADNATNLYVRIYHYWSTSTSTSSYLAFDNIEITATGTVAGVTKTMLDDRQIYTNTTSGGTAVINTNSSMKRNSFTVNGAGTNVTIPYLDLEGFGTRAGNLTVSNNAALNISSGTNTFYIDSARNTATASVLNITSGGSVLMSSEIENQGIINLENGTLNLNGKKLLNGGSFTRNTGTINAASGTIEMTSKKGAQDISGAFFVNRQVENLVNTNSTGINISATANDTLKVTGKISFGSVNNSVISTGNNLTLVSNATATASIGDYTNDGVNSGNQVTGKVNVERYISNGAKWRLLSVPTDGTQTFKQGWQESAASANGNPTPGYGTIIGDNHSATYIANGFDTYTPGGPTVKAYNATTNMYAGISSTNTAMKSAAAYMTYIRSNRSGALSATTLRTTGDLYGGTQPAITVAANKFASIGNPYASTIDLTKLNITGLQDVVYVWDPKLGGTYGLGAYQTLIKMGADYMVFPGGGSYGAQLSVVNTVESGQGFFVKALSTGGSIQFVERAKTIGGTRLVSREPKQESPMLRSTLYTVATDTTTLIDAAMVNFEEGFSDGIDEDDILKVANGSENVSIITCSTLLTANRRSAIKPYDTIRINLSGAKIQNYKWDIELNNMMDTGAVIFLLDAYTGIRTAINPTGITPYLFSVENIPASYAANRFTIIFGKADVVVLPVTITSVSAMRNSSRSNEVNVSWKVEDEINMRNYEVEYSADGSNFRSIQTVYPAAGNSGQANYAQLHTEAGAGDNFYRIKANSISGQVQYSAIVKVAATKNSSNGSISVYPNPVVNKVMNVSFLNQANGTYQVKLLNQSGAEVFRNNTTVSSSNQLKMMQLGSKAAPGAYHLVVTDETGRQQVQSIIVL